MKHFLKANLVWSVGIFVEDENYDISMPLTNLVKAFDAKQIRLRKKHIHTYADPFLFVHDEMLYLFIEIQKIGGKGYINAWKTDNCEEWIDLGPIIKEKFHYSYPFVFNKGGNIFLMPESSDEKKVFLFPFKLFPNIMESKITVLNGNYADSNIANNDGVYFLSTTNQDTNEFELFWSNSIFSNWEKHPQSPITTDKKINRNGGGFVTLNNILYRIAQNSEAFYGKGIVILKVKQMTKDVYEEEVINEDFRPTVNYSWQNIGRHHLSMVKFNDKTIIAIDGLQRDFFINRMINLLFKAK